MFPSVDWGLCRGGFCSLASSHRNPASALLPIWALDRWYKRQDVAEGRATEFNQSCVIQSQKLGMQFLSDKPDLEEVKSRQARRLCRCWNCWNYIHYQGSGTYYLFFFRKSTCFSHRWVSTVFPGYHVHLIQTFGNPQYTETSKDLIIKTRFSFMSCKFLYIQSKRITIAFFFLFFLCAVMKFDRLTRTRSSNSRLGRGGWACGALFALMITSLSDMTMNLSPKV